MKRAKSIQEPLKSPSLSFKALREALRAHGDRHANILNHAGEVSHVQLHRLRGQLLSLREPLPVMEFGSGLGLTSIHLIGPDLEGGDAIPE